ncbi:hypothetical protein ACFORO_07245 [Amycolatopsis halotolerans]|uniref:Uncharacterized protein n=1 Tax=Amycolatopsis halotolerans TaxID=330083 RepID=A0ABV7Q9I8_9PSEU
MKRVEDGRFSACLHDRPQVGDRLSVRGPSGSFHPGPRCRGLDAVPQVRCAQVAADLGGAGRP